VSKRQFLIFLLASCLFFIDVFLLGSYFSAVRTTSVPKALFHQLTVLNKIQEGIPPMGGEVSFVFVGDISYSRRVEKEVKKNNDINYPFLMVADYLERADLVFGNLETPITPGREIADNEMIFRSNPGTEIALKNAGISIVSLANNHTSNFGEKGLSDTVTYLDRAGIKHVGWPLNTVEVYSPTLFEVNKVKFAFFAYVDPGLVDGSKFSLDESKIFREISNAKNTADFVVVSMHAGSEYVNKPTLFQSNLAHAAIDAGADLVIGHHPHVVQTVEKYKGKYIFYSLGNFIFDQMWSKQTREALMLRIVFSKYEIGKIVLLPILIENYSQPHVANSDESETILKRINYPYAGSTDSEGYILVDNLIK
jgi:poly-gamma-glutamate capsule biosynthesis protein CapA/YwtB (metallophosphatase superfamily)